MLLVRLLGGVEIEKDGVARPYGARKYATLLALLALNPRRIFSRSELVAAIWPDSDEESGRGALRTALSTLRQELSAESLLTTRETVALASEIVTTDVALLDQGIRQMNQAASAADAASIFQRLQQLYRGSLLPGRYEDWIVTERTRIDDVMRGAQTRYEILHRTLEKEWPPEQDSAPASVRLPTFATRFLGREAEMSAVCAMLSDRSIRLVTLSGTGGIGKTRLAVEAAHRLRNIFPNSVFYIPLAACADGNEILTEVGRALFAESTVANDWEAAVSRRLSTNGDVLIVLDNMEHLVGQGAARNVRCLLDMSPLVSVLVTSRQLLGVEGEHIFPLQGLKDDSDQRLFAEHARCLQPDFEISDANRAAVEQLCVELEGIPLAIELCAAWIPVLTPQQILVKMTDRFSLLKSRRQDVLARHRSLHAALEWGCPTEGELLSFFLALSVFRGGFTLEAAEAVGGEDALDRLATLREQSLIVAETQENGTMRYRLLETIREFADEKLAPEARIKVQERHLACYAALADTVTSRLSGRETESDFAILERENPNFRVAIERGLDGSIENLLLARRTINWLVWFWRMRGHQMPQRAWLERIFARADELPPIDRAYLLLEYASYLPESEATALCIKALSLFETHADPLGISNAYESLGRLCRARGEMDCLIDFYRKAAAIREEIGDIRGKGYILAELAGSYFQNGDSVNARILWGECRVISESLGDIGSLAVLDRAEAGSLTLDLRFEDALALLSRATVTFRQKGETWNLMDTLERYGEALLGAELLQQAIVAFEEACILADKWGDTSRAERMRKEILRWNDLLTAS